MGLDGAGKTTLIYSMKPMNAQVETSPDMIDSVAEEMMIIDEHVKIVCLELDDGRYSDSWRKVYDCDICCIVFVVDSTDKSRFDAAKLALHSFLKQDKSHAPLLILMNKQDLPSASPVEELLNALEVSHLSDRKWQFYPTCLYTQRNINEILNMKLIVPATTIQLCLQQVVATGNLPSDDFEGSRDLMISHPTGDLFQPDGYLQHDAIELSQDVIAHERRKRDKLWKSWHEKPLNDDDDIFLRELTTYQLQSWNHYDHIRLAHCYFSRLDIQRSFNGIEKAIDDFVTNGPNTTGKSYHPTLTRFWCHMIAYWVLRKRLEDLKHRKNQRSFKSFLDFVHKNCEFDVDDIVNKNLFKSFYSQDRIFSVQARGEIIRPNIKGLPDLRILLKSIATHLVDDLERQEVMDDCQYIDDSDYWLHEQDHSS